MAKYIVSSDGIYLHISGDIYTQVMSKETFIEAFNKYIKENENDSK